MFQSLDDQLPNAGDLPVLPEEQQDPDEKPIPVKQIYILLFCSLAFIPLNAILGDFDNTTEIYPNHARVEEVCYWFTGFFAILACGTAIYLTRNVNRLRSLVLSFFITLEVSIGLFMAIDRIASFIEGAIDFPAGRTHVSETLFPIARAYQTHNKEPNQYIVTTPIWSNLKITHEDYTYMLTHRTLDDSSLNHDEISDFRYFCAKVTVEQTDKAMRVLHAGSQELPKEQCFYALPR